MFDKLDIKNFKMSELNGKTLRIVAGKDEFGMVIVMGYDDNDCNCYVLSIEEEK